MPRRTSRDELLAAAAKTFHESGYDRARVSDIVAAAGVSQGTFYLYFESKLDAFVETVAGLAEEIRNLASEFDWGPVNTGDDYRRQFTDLYEKAFELLDSRRAAAALLFQHSPILGGVPARIRRDLIDEMEAITALYIANGIERGLLRDLNVQVVARAVIGLLLHTVTRAILEGERTHDLQALAGELVEFEYYGAVARE